ncbi:MAG TPA: type I glyceraldehyde-3-phosphate dehydrogenase [Smithellaceae bacterium]|nr:type I glyceraldehyde-3-phosphate dehydrogenase [Smithellaceae bacterium]HRS90104.1 type I glyceraldehyde-3-phosphate dehydrogenase [Smithellaceae bacterium]HRV25643.1 type I glyceraldehyde-3-phosphate dehydrogenase [Smithellaceae bacterium]
MPVKIAINGFGRIGRLVYRAGFKSKDVEFVAVNDLADAKTLAHLLKYDSVHGIMNAEVKATDKAIVVDGREIKTFTEREPEKLPWKELGVDVVLESTGRFTDRAGAERHLKAGAKKVVVSAPAKNPDVTFVFGVNEEVYDKNKHSIISMGSCTTNCLAPIVKILHKEFGVEYGLMTTIHAYTNDQVVADEAHKDLRRARAAALSMIPTTTGAAKAISEVIPEMKGKLDGMAIRVPTPNVSLVDFVAVLSRETSKDELNAKFRDYAQGPMKGILSYSDEELVSRDFCGNPHSSIVDLPSTAVIGGRMIKILSWYDNEWGFSSRMLELLSFIMK